MELPSEPNAPPVVLPVDIELGSVIRFDSTRLNELRIPIRIRDEDTMETLKTRFRLESGNGGVPPTNFMCPEPELVGNGSEIRDNINIVIESGLIPRGACSRLVFLASASFLPCKQASTPEFFNVTTDADRADYGSATFWIWEVSSDTLVNPIASQTLLNTCQYVDRTNLPTTVDMTP